MSFVQNIFQQLRGDPTKILLYECHGSNIAAFSASKLLALVNNVRRFLTDHAIKTGDRVVFIAANSVCWVAVDLALLAENIVSVPLYSKQSITELISIIHDCDPKIIFVEDSKLITQLQQRLPQDLLKIFDFITLFQSNKCQDLPCTLINAFDPLTIVYTSGTTSEPKGVVITQSNVDFVYEAAIKSLDKILVKKDRVDRIYHYLPFNFMGSRLMLWTQYLINLSDHFINTYF